MEAVQPADDERASKRPRVGDAVDSEQNGLTAISIPELNRIKQSDNQLAYLQAQLAATESLYAAYQAELQSLPKQLGNVKRSHVLSGLPLWKDAGAPVDVAAAAQARRHHHHQQQQPSGGNPWDDDLDTYSDIEEEVLLFPTDELPVAEQPTRQELLQQQQQPTCQELLQQQQDTTAEGGRPSDQATAGATADGATDAAVAAAAAVRPIPQSPRAAGDGGEAAGATEDSSAAAKGAVAAAAGGGTAAAAAGEGAAVAEAAACASGMTVEAAAAAGADLEALEATCSAVAQEDMEAQGAVACLAGRTGKYYMRSIVVTLGRATESKGDVDLDLTPEEPPPPPRGAPAVGPAAAAGGPPAAVSPGAAAASACVVVAADDQSAAAQPAAGAGGGGAAAAVTAAAAGRGGGHAVSRRQAVVRLGPDGQFRLVNTGRQAVVVNEVVVPQHHTVNLPHLSLIEVAGVRLLFLANIAAVARVVRRSAALSL